MSKAIYVGNRFKWLTVISNSIPVEVDGGTEFYRMCECRCGKTMEVSEDDLRSGIKSCGGCKLEQPRLRHGHAKKNMSPTYKCWRRLKYHANKGRYELSPRWEQFENFLKDMGEKPEGGRLGRFENAKDKYYGPQTCTWLVKE